MMDGRFISEAKRLKVSPPEGTVPGGMGTVQFVADCPGNAAVVLQRVKEVLSIASEHTLSGWPPDEQWRSLLPAWFLAACAPEQTQAEADKWMAWWRTLPREQQIRVDQEKEWSLHSWLYWMKPENRIWTWWDARAIDTNTVIVAVEVTFWPFPWGALRWLFRAAGARQLESEI